MAESTSTKIPTHLRDKTFGKDRYDAGEIITGRRRGKFYAFHPTPAERDQIYDFCLRHAIHARSLPTPARLFQLLRTIGYFNDWQPLDAHLAHRLLDFIAHPSTQHALTRDGHFVAQDAWQDTKAELKQALLTHVEEAGPQGRPQASIEEHPGLEQQHTRRFSVSVGGMTPGSLSRSSAREQANPSSHSRRSSSAPPSRMDTSPPPLRTVAPPPTPDQKALLTTLRLDLPARITSGELYAELERAAEQLRHTIAARNVEVDSLREQFVRVKNLQAQGRRQSGASVDGSGS